MTEVVVEVGPATVRGPNAASAQWVTAAIECIDDDIALVADRPVSVAELWRGVLGDAVGGYGDVVVLVIPTWWTSSRIDVVRRAAEGIAGTVVVRQRPAVLRDGLPGRSMTVVEVAQDFVVVSPDVGELAVVPRGGVADVDVVMREVGVVAAAVVDVPDGIDSGFGSQIAERLRADGITVTVAGDVLRRVTDASTREAAPVLAVDAVPIIRRRRASAVMAGALVAGAVLCDGFATRHDPPAPPAAVPAMTLLVEGRVGMTVPAQWPVERITSGPGSARVQIISPSESDVVVHMTQSALPPGETQEAVAESLRQALSEQPPGVFIDFNPADRRADKPAVTYREVRRDHHIAWAVFIDDDVRIAIGCQSAPDRESLVRDACVQAVRSAHAVF